MPDYLVQEEDGTSRIEQEENTDFVLLESDDVTQARVSHLAVEVVVRSDAAIARVSQMPVEVVHRRLNETIDVFIIDALPQD